MQKLRRRLCALTALVLLGSAGLASAQEVTLRSADGSVHLSGTLLDYDGEFYHIASKFGEMVLNAQGVICSGFACPDPGQYAADVTLSGSADIGLGLMPALIEDFSFHLGETALRADHGSDSWTYFISDAANVPVARIQSHLTNTASGLVDLIEHRTDLALATRIATGPEQQAALAAGVGDLTNPYRRQIVALDGLVFVVSRKNPISSISVEDVIKILQGEVTNWAELGGVNARIAIYRPVDGSDLANDIQVSLFAGDMPTELAPALLVPDNAALSDAVALDPFGFGITTFSVKRNAKPLALRGNCGVLAWPNRFSLQSEDYPFTRRLYVFSAKKRLPVFARNLLAWFDRDIAQISVQNTGFVGQLIEKHALVDQQDRLANAIRAAGDDIKLAHLKGFVQGFSNALRLSTTFRFENGSTQMDDRAQRSIRKLAEQIEFGDFDGRELIFAGFSDSQGGAEGNRRISRQRAEQIMSAVKSAAPRADLSKVTFLALGMGEVSPLACDDTELGRHTNRRVEVWVK